MYQQNTVGKQSSNEFFGMCTVQDCIGIHALDTLNFTKIQQIFIKF